MMVIEELHFLVDIAEQREFLRVEHEVWTGFLQTCDGFVSKETWTAEDEPERIVMMIWWNSMEEWRRITPEQCNEVDARMGSWLRPVAFFRAHNVVRKVGLH
jgi:uncharacterized protein (TIGR03792 family)